MLQTNGANIGGVGGGGQPDGSEAAGGRTPASLANRADREPPSRHESLSRLCSGCLLGMTREREGVEGNLVAKEAK